MEIFKTSRFECDIGRVVFFTVTPLGAGIGGIGCALLFGFIVIRDGKIVIEREPASSNDRYVIDMDTGKLHLCNAKNAIVVWPKPPIVSVRTNLAIRHGVDTDAPWAVAV